MQIQLKNWHLMVAFVLLSPVAAFPADIEINGFCVQGTCPPPAGTSDALQFGQSTSGASSYNLTFGNGDKYSVAWSYSASYTGGGTAIFVSPTATYIGSTPSAGNDVITFDLFQNYYDNSPGSWDGSYTETVPLLLSGNAGSGSTVSGQLFYDGQGLGLAGPYGPGSNFVQRTASLTGLTAPTLLADYQFTFDFQGGTQAGASGSSPVPEPAETLPLAVIGVLGCSIALRRRASYTNLVQGEV